MATGKIEMLTQPLLTEDGFINEACINELSAAIANMPETHERLKDDPEWNTKRLTHFRDITAAFAYWAIHQFACDEKHAPFFAPGLESQIGLLSQCLKPEFDELGYAVLSLCDINKMCWDILRDSKVFNSWNDNNVLPNCWLDLSALLHNVCLTIRMARREWDKFNREFEEKHG